MEVVGNWSRRNAALLVDSLRFLGGRVRGWGSLQHPRTQLLMLFGFKGEERDHFVECRYFIERATPRSGEFYYSLGDYDVY
jgi:hypothetical protein